MPELHSATWDAWAIKGCQNYNPLKKHHLFITWYEITLVKENGVVNPYIFKVILFFGCGGIGASHIVRVWLSAMWIYSILRKFKEIIGKDKRGYRQTLGQALVRKLPSNVAAAQYQGSEDPDEARDPIAFLEHASLPELALVFGHESFISCFPSFNTCINVCVYLLTTIE